MGDIPLYEACKSSAAVRNLLGGNTLRIYEFGQAPSKPVLPYVTWQQITGYPENNLSERPDHDYFSTQIDIYAATGISAQTVKTALVDAIEPVTNITSWNGEGRDSATTNYRITFSADWFIGR